MRPYSVFQAQVDGVTVPARSLRPLGDAWAAWCASEGIDDTWVKQVDVTRFDDGTLIAYCTRYEELPPTELALAREKHESISGLAVYPGQKPLMTRTYITHHPVSSIQPLLDAAFPRGVTCRPDCICDPGVVKVCRCGYKQAEARAPV